MIPDGANLLMRSHKVFHRFKAVLQLLLELCGLQLILGRWETVIMSQKWYVFTILRRFLRFISTRATATRDARFQKKKV